MKMDKFNLIGAFSQEVLAMLDNKYDFDFSPRHGSMLSITDEEYERIEKYFK